jgi:hypothetical protein
MLMKAQDITNAYGDYKGSSRQAAAGKLTSANLERMGSEAGEQAEPSLLSGSTLKRDGLTATGESRTNTIVRTMQPGRKADDIFTAQASTFREVSKLDQDDAYGAYCPMFQVGSKKVEGKSNRIQRLQRQNSTDIDGYIMKPIVRIDPRRESRKKSFPRQEGNNV